MFIWSYKCWYINLVSNYVEQLQQLGYSCYRCYFRICIAKTKLQRMCYLTLQNRKLAISWFSVAIYSQLQALAMWFCKIARLLETSSSLKIFLFYKMAKQWNLANNFSQCFGVAHLFVYLLHSHRGAIMTLTMVSMASPCPPSSSPPPVFILDEWSIWTRTHWLVSETTTSSGNMWAVPFPSTLVDMLSKWGLIRILQIMA